MNKDDILNILRMDLQQVTELFMIFNVSGDGSMRKQEIVYLYNGWLTKVTFKRAYGGHDVELI